MDYDHEGQVVNFVSGLLLGAVIGAGIALLTAPEPGKRARRRIRKAAFELKDNAADRWDELADDVKGRVDDAFATARKSFAR
ncbi:MAG: YtxH domain-containing protein [Gemmatimonadota bacterium]|nr:YtxH domain-containing protein [Gemmatimonadota bacterium]MDH5758075.1 YtxH domain-containing protein [Gemmatimonadota bacterium]